MSELDDFKLNEGGDSEPSREPPDEPRSERPSSPPVWAAVVVIAALALIAVLYFWFFGRTPPPPEPVPTAESAPTVPRPEGRVEGEPIEQEPLPELQASDAVVRRLVGGLSANPQLAAWLVNEDLVRRFVVAVDNIAEGEAPKPHLGFLEPQGDFVTESDGERRVIADSSFDRYDLVTAVFTSLDTDGTIELYRRLEPLLQEAYADLGYPNRDFTATLIDALEVIADTPRPPDEIEVVRAVKSYEFADPRLERLSSIEKQLVRLGPDNLERVQAKAEALAKALAAN